MKVLIALLFVRFLICGEIGELIDDATDDSVGVQ